MPSARCTFLITRRYFFNFISTQARFSYSRRSSCFDVKHTHVQFCFSRLGLWSPKTDLVDTTAASFLYLRIHTTDTDAANSIVSDLIHTVDMSRQCLRWELVSTPDKTALKHSQHLQHAAVWHSSNTLVSINEVIAVTNRQVLPPAVQIEFSTTQGRRQQKIWKVKQSK